MVGLVLKIGLIDHPYHKKTKSTVFIQSLLKQVGAVYNHWEVDWWAGGGISDLAPVLDAGYDLIVCLQTEFLAPVLLRAHSNVIIIPMFDGAHQWREGFWRQCMRARIVSFCREQHEYLLRLGCDSFYFQYAPDPSKFDQVDDFSNLRGFFWERLPEQLPATDYALRTTRSLGLQSLHVHQVPDNGESSIITNDPKVKISTSTWFETKSQYLRALENANLFIQPRVREGIGMGFLEAMAMGQIVVSPDFPTMNEYITNSVNGLLFDISKPNGLTVPSLENLKSLGGNARFTIEGLHEEWVESENRLLQLFSLRKGHDSLREPVGQTEPVLLNSERSDVNEVVEIGEIQKGRITIGTVVFNSEKSLERTIQSVGEINYPDLEFIVIDGGSTDNSVKVIEANVDVIDDWVSERDLGPFDAMNKLCLRCTGEYILFLNAGDVLKHKDVLNRVMKGVANCGFSPEFVIGHHFWKRDRGGLNFRRVNPFEVTWNLLMQDKIDIRWLERMPCHQSTLTSTNFLRENPFDLSFNIAADHELLFRGMRLGAKFYHANMIIGIYEEGGISSQNTSRLNVEWYDIAKKYAPESKSADKLYFGATGFLSLDYLSKTELEGGLRFQGSIEDVAVNRFANLLRPYPFLFNYARRAYQYFRSKRAK